MTRKELLFCILSAIFFLLAIAPARAQEKPTDMELLAGMVKDLTTVIKEQNQTIRLALERQPAFGMPQPIQPIIEAEKPCTDSLLGCFLRGTGSLLVKAGAKGIDFLDRNAVPLLQVVGADRAATRNAEAAIRTAEFAYMERRDVAQAHSSAVSGLGVNLQNVATRGFDVFAGLPPSTVNNIRGTGINFGNGTLTYAPISGSYNPVNPVQRTCALTGTPATLVCQ